jgi:hypothetical protein
MSKGRKFGFPVPTVLARLALRWYWARAVIAARDVLEIRKLIVRVRDLKIPNTNHSLCSDQCNHSISFSDPSLMNFSHPHKCWSLLSETIEYDLAVDLLWWSKKKVEFNLLFNLYANSSFPASKHSRKE